MSFFNIPSLPPEIIYKDSTYPLTEQIDKLYTNIADVVNSKASNNVYQTNELPTNDLWVDGRTVFNKTIATGAISQGATNNIPHGITNFRSLVDIRVLLTDGTTSKILPYASPTAANSASVDVNATNVVVMTGASFGTGYSGYVVMQYITT